MLKAQINLKTILNNINNIKNICKKEVIPVVKSNAYGLGDYEVVKYLFDNGIKYFAVVDIKEAKRLIEKEKSLNLLVLNSISPSDIDFVIENNIIISINSYSDAIMLAENIEDEKLRVHIQIDTGMNRLGLRNKEEAKETINLLKNLGVDIEGIYTHFTSSNNFPFQHDKFKEFLSLYNFPIIHCAATPTYSLSPVGNFVRVGLEIYGYKEENGFSQALTISTLPLAINSIKKGETVGYDEVYVAQKNTRIAVLPIGYNDGYRRSLKGFYVYANNKKYMVVGNICMNHTFVEVDDEVTTDTIFYITSKELPINLLADYLDTNYHEILCMFRIDEKEYIR